MTPGSIITSNMPVSLAIFTKAQLQGSHQSSVKETIYGSSHTCNVVVAKAAALVVFLVAGRLLRCSSAPRGILVVADDADHGAALVAGLGGPARVLPSFKQSV